MNTPTNKDFDAIALAVESGNLDELEKLMSAEEEQEATPTETEESVEVVEDVTDTETVEDGEESDTPPSEVEDDDGEDEQNVAAVTAATSDKSEREQELERELQRYKSDAGRVPFIQRRMSELERELRAYKARDAQPTTGTNGKPTIKTDAVQLDEETQKEIDELREIDPVMAKTLERVAKAALAAAKASTDHVVDTFTQADREEEEQRFLMEQNSILVSRIPQAHQIFATPEWQAWKDTLTPGARALAESSYASEVEQAIYAFAAAVKGNEAPKTEVAAPVISDAEKKVKEARERKVQGSVDVKAPSGRKSEELDPDKYFQEMYNQIGKESHILK